MDDASDAAPTRPANTAAPPAVEEALVEGIVLVGPVAIVAGVVIELNTEEVALESIRVLDAWVVLEAEVLGVEVLGIEVLGVDVLGIEVLGVDVLGIELLGPYEEVTDVAVLDAGRVVVTSVLDGVAPEADDAGVVVEQCSSGTTLYPDGTT